MQANFEENKLCRVNGAKIKQFIVIILGLQQEEFRALENTTTA